MKQDERQAIEHAARALGYDPDRIDDALAETTTHARAFVAELSMMLTDGIAEEIERSGKIGRRGATTKDMTVVNYVAGFRVREGRDPTLGEMREAFPDLPRSSAQRYRRTAA